ncbi:hypothetical protein C8Q80DRAFT_1112318 [Daedaleopsis nitida]|nr:hypothetical protein C8Q80DRAFT_1112318 [Daedaleopsis nitida]
MPNTATSLTHNPELADPQLALLRESIVFGPPYCQGIVPVSPTDIALFYGRTGKAECIDLSAATPEQLQHLANACQPATFGIDQQDVYDETYRKVGKLDVEDFALHFNAQCAGLLDVVHAELANDCLVKNEAIRAELYKLNVYGPGSFFKSHVDTPRSELQFGSLVVVFPTAHKGGALKIRYSEDVKSQNNPTTAGEWTFDSGALLAGCAEPSIAYVAFFSNIEHEVLPVTSGYRVTITYNLYLDEGGWSSTSPMLHIPCTISMTEEKFSRTLRTLLNDPTFLPDGGHLLFGLSHKYPLLSTLRGSAACQALLDVTTWLKGNDAVIFKVMQEFSLPVALKTIYTSKELWTNELYHVACDRVLPLEYTAKSHDDIHRTICDFWGGQVLSGPEWGDLAKYLPLPNVRWVVSAPEFTHVKTMAMAYGNDALLQVVYWKLYLLARVGPVGERSRERRRTALAETKRGEEDNYAD